MENAIVQRMKNQLKNLRVLSEELEVQMALGKAEAKDLFEKERKNLSQFINKQREQLDVDNTNTVQHRREMLTAVENLESTLNTAAPTKVRAYDKYKNDVLKNIYRVEEIIKDNYSEMSQEMQAMFNSFKAKMDAFRVNLALHDKDNPEKVAQIKNEFSEKLTEVRGLLSQNETDQTQLDQFMEDISESFNYFRRAIDDLAKR